MSFRISGIAVKEGLNTLCCSRSLQVPFVKEVVRDCATRIHQAFLQDIGMEESDIILDAIATAEVIVSQADALLTKVCLKDNSPRAKGTLIYNLIC